MLINVTRNRGGGTRKRERARGARERDFPLPRGRKNEGGGGVGVRTEGQSRWEVGFEFGVLANERSDEGSSPHVGSDLPKDNIGLWTNGSGARC